MRYLIAKYISIFRSAVLLILLLSFQHLSAIATSVKNCSESCNFPKVFVHHCASPVATSEAGGSSTFFRPLIKAEYRGCGTGISNNHSHTLAPGEMHSMVGFTYTAFLQYNTDVCDYINGNDLSDEYPADQYYDTQTINTYKNLCQQSAGQSYGICVYRSSWYDFGVSVSDASLINTTKIWGGASNSSLPSGISWNKVRCFPIPISPLPPPFCDIPVISPQIAEIFPLCTNSSSPYVNYNASPNSICVQPSATQSPNANMFSSYAKSCVRVALSESCVRALSDIQQSNELNSNCNTAGESISFCGSNEMLYTAPWKSVSGGGIYIRSIKGAFNGTTIIQPTPYSVNLGPYVDLCYDYSTLSGDAYSLQDTCTKDIRTFQVIRSCENNGLTCNSADNPIHEDTEICVKETTKGKTTYTGCVSRPRPAEPVVTFCDGTINTASANCMKITNGSITYQLTNSKAATAASDMYQYSLAYTDACYNLPSDCNGLCADNALTAGHSTSCNSCPQSGVSCKVSHNNKLYYAPGTLSKGLCNPIPSYKGGATKLCLNGYTPISPPSCKIASTPCDVDIPDYACADFISFFGISDTADTRICSRKNPTSNVSGKLSFGCPFNSLDQNNSTQGYRSMNPIELGLCIDILLFDFVATPANADKELPKPTLSSNFNNYLSKSSITTSSINVSNLFTHYKNYCSVSSDNQIYDNAASCNSDYIACLATPEIYNTCVFFKGIKVKEKSKSTNGSNVVHLGLSIL